MKYAVVEHAGKQFVAAEGQRIEVDRLGLQAGAAVEFGEVLLLRDTDRVEVGAPYVSGARVTGTVEAHIRGPKILVFKYRPKQRYRVRGGHRQELTRVTIESVGLPGTEPKARAAEPKAEPAAPKTEPAAPRRPARKPAEKAPAAAKPKAAARRGAPKSKPAEKGKAGGGTKKPAAAKKSAASKKK